MRPNQQSDLLVDSLKKRILVIDGAMGTAIQQRNLTARDFGGPDYEGCNEYLVRTRPDVISAIHREYLQAGADIVETNTFGATELVLNEYNLGHLAPELNLEAAKLARAAADEFSTPARPRFVAGSIGPTTKAISVTGGITFEELEKQFHDQAKALLEGGVDYFLIETCQDTRNVKAALVGIDRLFREGSPRIPIAVSGTIEATGTMLGGQTVDAFLTSIAHVDLLYIGLNCATGPEFMTDHLRTLAALSPFPVACVPNAGLPDENGHYLESPKMVAAIVNRFIESGWINLVGGCCGTNVEHIRALADVAAAGKPRSPSTQPRSALSGVDYLEITDEMRPVIVGERTNVIGSRKFKDMITAEKYEEASDIARVQVRNGAQIIDVCVANPDRDELKDMRSLMDILVKKIRTPIMIDSTDANVIAEALTYCQGKAIINSVNLEDGEERIAHIAPLARRFGAALVVGTIDEDPKQGMALTRKRKLEVALRSHELLTRKYGFATEDLYFDPLVFPCASGDEQYKGSAVETIEGLRAIKQAMPRCKTVLGISNVSFGLPQAGREVLNSVFLYHCVQAGLDLAIVNSEKLERYAAIPEEERKLAEDLLFTRGADPIAAFAAHFREKKPQRSAAEKARLPLMERLPRYVVEGSKDGLTADLDEALKTMKPLEIINGPLMSGMDEVGRLFNKNQLIVAEVLQSAEVMKAAVSHLEPHMEKASSQSRGKVILATVKGDVHDIGKNLVEIILANNGFEVINLGIKVPPEQLIEAARKHQPDMIGLSGLLVKSAHQMTATAEDFAKAGIKLPLLVGGAALTQSYVDRHIAKAYEGGTVAYASDAMNGLELAKTVVDPAKFDELKRKLGERRVQLAEAKPATVPANPTSRTRSANVETLKEVPAAPDFERHLIRNTPLDQIWTYINPLMLYGRHLGVKGATARLLPKLHDPKIRRELESSDPRALEIADAVEQIKNEFRHTEVLQPSAVYAFFRASSEGNQLELRDGSDKPAATFTFPRQSGPEGLCLADYVLPKESGRTDAMALFVVTVGRGVRELSEAMKSRGEYLRSHVLQALAIESAEGYAELLHAKLRAMWGFADPPEITMLERFQAKYRGKRYSFGYPACPRLDDQRMLFDALKAEEIGVQLTDGMMMDPESSVSAIVFHHPAAQYFSVGTQRGTTDEDQR